jgi:hypothetical protein
MNSIKGIEKIIAIYPTWKISDSVFIKSIEWANDNLIIILYSQFRNRVSWPDMNAEFLEVRIGFKDVSDFRVAFTGSGLQQVSGLDIIDVSENGLEGINFEIEDYENDVIKFACKEIEILAISQPRRLES